MKRIVPILLSLFICLPGCAFCAGEPGYRQIDQETAAEMMQQDGSHIIVDVRTQEEYDEGHIPGAICIPNESIGSDKPEALPDPEQIILVYCRSGRRSKEAARKLADLGYTNIYEFGGIIDWKGEIVTEEKTMKLTIGDTEVPVTWENNESVKELEMLIPLTIQMSMYGGFEQVGPIGRDIARDDRQTAAEPGDIVLYSGDQIVVFYGSNSWAYTKLGHVDLEQKEMEELLGHGDVEILISR